MTLLENILTIVLSLSLAINIAFGTDMFFAIKERKK